MGFKETAGAMIEKQAAENRQAVTPAATEKTTKPKRSAKKAQSIDAILAALDDEQAAQLSKKLAERSQYGSDGEEKRTQRLTLLLRPSIVRKAREAAKAGNYKSLTDYIEDTLERSF